MPDFGRRVDTDDSSHIVATEPVAASRKRIVPDSFMDEQAEKGCLRDFRGRQHSSAEVRLLLCVDFHYTPRSLLLLI